MPKRRTHDGFVAELKEKRPDIEVIGGYYKNCKTSITVYREECDHSWTAEANSLLHSTQCPKCTHHDGYTHEEFVDIVAENRPYLEIVDGEYTNSHCDIIVRCKECGETWPTKAYIVMQKRDCPSCNNVNGLNREQFEDRIHSKHPHLELIGKYSVSQERVHIKCSIDGYDWNPTRERVLAGDGCPICSNSKTVVGFNDFNTKNPDLVKLLKNPKDGESVGYGNGKVKLEIICPDCGYEDKISASILSRHGFTCKRCSDNISYPNKFIREFLRQFLDNDYDCEFSPIWAEGRSYDTYFVLNAQEYIIEMDGDFHYEGNGMNNTTAEDNKAIDDWKDKVAQEHDIIVIRIDSRESTVNYIRSSIEKSMLKDIFDLSKVDWNSCGEKASSNLAKEVAVFYQEHKFDMTCGEIRNLFKISDNALLNYLKAGNEFGWCEYSATERRSLGHKMNKSTKMIPVNLYRDNKFINTFISLASCSEYMSKIGFPIGRVCISKHLKNDNGVWKNFRFEYAK